MKILVSLMLFMFFVIYAVAMSSNRPPQYASLNQNPPSYNEALTPTQRAQLCEHYGVIIRSIWELRNANVPISVARMQLDDMMRPNETQARRVSIGLTELPTLIRNELYKIFDARFSENPTAMGYAAQITCRNDVTVRKIR